MEHKIGYVSPFYNHMSPMILKTNFQYKLAETQGNIA